MASIAPVKMDDAKLNTFLDNELRQTIGYGTTGDEISDERRKNLEYYLNRPLGDEEEGRSSLQSSDVQDVVEALLPDTLAPFISADKVVEFKGVGIEDEEYAATAGPYVNHIFSVDNNGVEIQYTWQKDGLLQKNGFVCAEWHEPEKTALKTQRVDYAGLVTLQQDKEIEILKYAGFSPDGPIDPKVMEETMASPDPSLLNGMEFDVNYRRTWKEGRVKVQNIPPEYVVVSKTAKDTGTSRLIGWQEKVTISDLREEGHDEALLEKINFDDSPNTDNSGERTARERAQGGDISGRVDSTDPASRIVWRSVLWAHVDYDGDGKAELRKIIRAGAIQTGGVILLNEEADEIPVISFTPIIMPHQLFGRCPADQTRSIQDGKTSMLRMGMDATYNTVYPRPKLDVNKANEDTWDDLLLNIPGAPVRMNGLDAVDMLREAPDLSAAYQMLEYLDRMREIRTPVTRQDQGIDANALADKTAQEARIEANASAKKKELILRLYAEALGRLFRLINRIVIKNQDKPRMLRLFPDKPPVEVDPRFWNADMDVSVKVGLGTGTKDQQVQSLMMINQLQTADLQMGLPTVDPEKLYATRARLVEVSGLSNPELYFNNPKGMQQQQQQDPAQAEAQQKAQQDQVNQAIQGAHEQGKKEGADQIKVMEIQSKEKMKAMELEAEHKKAVETTTIQARPATQIQFPADEALGSVAQSLSAATAALEQAAVNTERNNVQNLEAMQQMGAAIVEAAKTMAAPKRVVYENGRPAGIVPMGA